MEQTKYNRNVWKKVAMGVIGAVLVTALGLGLAVYATWRNELSTLASMTLLKDRNDEHLDGAVYTMHVKGDFYLDDFIAQGGVNNDTELIDFVTEKITKGLIPINISDPEIGCSSFTARSEGGDVLFGRNQ